ncbi:MAG: hypothetical protein AAF604_08505 [Acidobacteriota bacterium]
MLRATAAVVAGYITMVVWVMVTLTIAWVAVGPSFAFQDGTVNVTAGWLAINLPLGLVGAIFGGFITAWVGRSWGPVKALMVVIVVVSVLSMLVQGSKPEVPADLDLSSLEAASYAQQPGWYAVVVALVGVVGVYLGGGLRLRPGKASEVTPE